MIMGIVIVMEVMVTYFAQVHPQTEVAALTGGWWAR